MKNIITHFTLVFGLLASGLTSLSHAQSGPSTLEELKTEVNTILRETQAPAIGIALIEQGQPVWVAGLGEANLENHKAADENTLFRMGSVSKMFAGVAVMQLVDEGRLALDDKLAELLPDFIFENPWADTDPVRLAHLLEHTTGWDVHLGEYAGEAPDSMTLEEGLNNHPDSRVSRWVPGTRYSYSNTGPVVAAHVVEKVTGLSFDQYVEQHIFTPLKMPSSSFLKTADYNERGATCYTKKGPTEYLHIYSRPSSSLNTSPKEMVNFLSMFIERGEFAGNRLLSEKAINRMQESKTTLGGKTGIHGGYGLTVDAFGHDNWNTAFYGHTGGLQGAVSDFIYHPTLKSGYVFMINQDNAQAFHRLSNTLKSYLLKNSVKSSIEKQALPVAFTQLNGLYTPINPIFELGKIQLDISGVMKFTTDDSALHRSPFFGGWQSNDYSPKNSNGQFLVSDWSGLPSIAIVQDPIAGEAVQVEGVLYKKTSALIVYGRLACLMLSALMIISSLLYALYWVPVSLYKKYILQKSESRGQVKFRLQALILSVILVLFPLFMMISGADPKLIMQSLLIGGFLFAVSALYPIAVGASVFSLLLAFKNSATSVEGKSRFWYSSVVIGAHAFIAIYLGYYGLLGFRVWA